MIRHLWRVRNKKLENKTSLLIPPCLSVFIRLQLTTPELLKELESNLILGSFTNLFQYVLKSDSNNRLFT